ncbi:cytochrome bd-I oxidase subunit CydX [Kerstersia gyiorum]|jgi:cyd operon protein YbgT|uniref:Cyd operon protein YbgT n=1 Tax=Kerstersia gyiorum TaxID=206506 RepID=A0A4V2F1F7_9BURK|nr:cytochrome bd-I oxidase subunit CydX [Kerstersia gyiorum]AZV94858.1 cytochrome bd-I oxidase subunit CydX [Bordetella sp. J329]MCO7635738.1 cytochrome bd-I oxidase subunit CydX [Pseudomonas sp. S 311-6]KAB0545009.1 cytochrome bd-I oxidase subunit CydX [Kerstersia gyiorum]MCH4272088.1 cytochrome bd-I oxidase subunit CydX [Kerstersia gyiorum]MCP1632272.1 cyd operon protein YbgT [Kerstersia gyiorum]
MWYLTWLLGLALACAFTVGCGLWYEVHQKDLDGADPGGVGPAVKRS